MHSTLDNISKNGNLAPARISATMRNMRKTWSGLPPVGVGGEVLKPGS